MNRLLKEIGRTPRLEIVHELKRANGLPVRELARRLAMSYMGVKQHCIELHRDGYLDTWRNPKPVGRPELLYRLTQKTHELFPTQSHELLLGVLEGARQLYGPTAPGKLLFLHFRALTEDYAARVRGETPGERARWLARLRERDGCMATFEPGPPARILERHSPMAALFERFPELENMEREMVERVIGARVRRMVTSAGALYEVAFEFTEA